MHVNLWWPLHWSINSHWPVSLWSGWTGVLTRWLWDVPVAVVVMSWADQVTTLRFTVPLATSPTYSTDQRNRGQDHTKLCPNCDHQGLGSEVTRTGVGSKSCYISIRGQEEGSYTPLERNKRVAAHLYLSWFTYKLFYAFTVGDGSAGGRAPCYRRREVAVVKMLPLD